jgi:hypothetical protein
VCRIFRSSSTLCNASSFLTRLAQLISILLQHHTKLRSKYSASLISSLNLSPVSRQKESFSCWMLLLPCQS